jgi:DNA-binding response OmpR family regulator
VLLIDDEQLVLRSVSRVLELGGYRVVAVATGEAAMAACGREHSDAVLCDLHLPGLSGAPLWNQIWRAAPGLAGRILIITGDHISEQLRELSRRCGVPPMIKPFTATDLLAAVGMICPRPAHARPSEGYRRAAS